MKDRRTAHGVAEPFQTQVTVIVTLLPWTVIPFAMNVKETVNTPDLLVGAVKLMAPPAVALTAAPWLPLGDEVIVTEAVSRVDVPWTPCRTLRVSTLRLFLDDFGTEPLRDT
jgi:hypothetical protein